MKASKIIANSDEIIRKMIRDYLTKHGITLNAFCHPLLPVYSCFNALFIDTYLL